MWCGTWKFSFLSTPYWLFLSNFNYYSKKCTANLRNPVFTNLGSTFVGIIHQAQLQWIKRYSQNSAFLNFYLVFGVLNHLVLFPKCNRCPQLSCLFVSADNTRYSHVSIAFYFHIHIFLLSANYWLAGITDKALGNYYLTACLVNQGSFCIVFY